MFLKADEMRNEFSAHKDEDSQTGKNQPLESIIASEI
jgi:hypothetical protein